LEGTIDAGCFVWRYDVKQKKFFEEAFFNEKFDPPIHRLFRIHLLYLDNDKYPDLVAVDGFDGNGWIYILLGSEKGFKSVFDWWDNCSDLYDYTAGSCGDMEFACEKIINLVEDPGIMYFFRFNCDKRKFEKYAEGQPALSDGIITSIDLKSLSVVINDSKDTSYKFYKGYSSGWSAEELKKMKLKKGDKVSLKYVTIDGKKIIIDIWKK